MEYEPSDEADDEQDLQAKILEDKIYSTHKGMIEIYRSQISDNVHRIVFEAYIDKGYTTARSMAALSLVSTPTIAKWRKKLGYEGFKLGGEYNQLYTIADAKKIAKYRTNGVSLQAAGRKAGYKESSTYTIALRFRSILPSTQNK